MWEIIVCLILLLGSGISLLLCLIQGLIGVSRHIRHLSVDKTMLHIKHCGGWLLFFLSVFVIFVGFTQLTTSTPAIKNEQGKQVIGSIAELRQVKLNGHKEWISIRGKDKTKPVLLFLAGGPGGSQMAAVRYDLAELEKDFVVVNWDQPGSAKSYYAVPRKELTVETYIEDGYALTQYLCQAFNQDKIYLLGESWGSALGIMLAQKHPESYYAMIGTGQMVDFLETEEIDYQFAMNQAMQEGNTKLVNKLKQNGKPPYYGKDVTWKSATYLNYLSGVMATDPNITNGGFNTWRDLAASEYGMLDKVNYLMGIMNTFNHVYPQLYDIDLRESYAKLEVPVYILVGKHDINAPIVLTEDYYEKLEAPYKEIVWFEHSGHNPWINESAKFVECVVQIAQDINE